MAQAPIYSRKEAPSSCVCASSVRMKAVTIRYFRNHIIGINRLQYLRLLHRSLLKLCLIQVTREVPVLCIYTMEEGKEVTGNHFWWPFSFFGTAYSPKYGFSRGLWSLSSKVKSGSLIVIQYCSVIVNVILITYTRNYQGKKVRLNLKGINKNCHYWCKMSAPRNN